MHYQIVKKKNMTTKDSDSENIFLYFNKNNKFTDKITILLEKYFKSMFYEMLAMNYLHVDTLSIVNDLSYDNQYFMISHYSMKFDIVFYEDDNKYDGKFFLNIVII